MIIETSANRFYRVIETAEEALAHCWYGIPVKFVRGEWVLTAAAVKNSAKHELVCKAATRIVEA